MDSTYCGDHIFNVIELIVHSSFEVDVHGRPGLRRAPGGQQQGPLQNEAIRVGRLCEAIQESLHREILKQFLKRAALRARLVEQALPDGGSDITSAHITASRYGRMTF